MNEVFEIILKLLSPLGFNNSDDKNVSGNDTSFTNTSVDTIKTGHNEYFYPISFTDIFVTDSTTLNNNNWGFYFGNQKPITEQHETRGKEVVDSTDIRCSIPGIADLFRGLRDSSTVNLKKITGFSREFVAYNFQVYVGNDTINVKSISVVADSHHVTSSICSSLKRARHNPALREDYDVWRFSDAPNTNNYKSLVISVDSLDRSKMVKIIKIR